MRSVLSHIEQRTTEAPHRVCLRTPDRLWTRQAVWQAAERLADQLALLRLPPGAPAGLRLWNQPEWVISLLALWQRGHVVVPINPALTLPELARLSSDAGLCLMVTDDRAAPPDISVCRWLQPGQPPQFQPASPSLLQQGPDMPMPQGVCLLIYTSGTTGQPKGVMLTEANLLANVAGNRAVLHVTDADGFLSVSPFFHVFGLINVLLTSLLNGAELTLIRRFHPGRVLAALPHVSILMAVPTLYRPLLNAIAADRPADATALPWRRLRVCHSGAAPLSLGLFHAVERGFGVPVQEGYGLSEATSIVTVNPLDGRPRRPGHVGLPLPALRLGLRDDAGRWVTAPDTPGELVVQGPTVMAGYWRQPALTAGRFYADAGNPHAWLRTGDRMTCNADGYYRFLGRRDDQLNLGGLKCYPLEIEMVLTEHPAVDEAAVFFSTDQQTLLAHVALNRPASEKALRAWCLARLSPYKVPRRFIVVDALPKGATGKLLRHRLIPVG